MKFTTILLAITLATTTLAQTAAGGCKEGACVDCRKISTSGVTGTYCQICKGTSITGTGDGRKCGGTIITNCEISEMVGAATTVTCNKCKAGYLLNADQTSCTQADGTTNCKQGDTQNAGTTKADQKCTACEKGKYLNNANFGNECMALGTKTEDPNCLYNGGLKTGSTTAVACLVCKDKYYVANEACTKYADGSDPACYKEDASNTDNKCPIAGANEAMICRIQEKWFAVDNDGTNVTCKNDAQLLSVFFAFVGLVAMAVKF